MANYGKTSGKNWAIFALVILLALAIFFGVVTEGFRNWDTSTWFGKEETDQSAVIDDEGNEMDSETVYALPPRDGVQPCGARRDARNNCNGESGH